VLAVSGFRKAGWVGEPSGVASRLEIEVRGPVVKHTVTLAQLQRWANGATTSPAEKVRRERMRRLPQTTGPFRSVDNYGGYEAFLNVLLPSNA
jgi:hypothetical protein